jgi:hypothetical protein
MWKPYQPQAAVAAVSKPLLMNRRAIDRISFSFGGEAGRETIRTDARDCPGVYAPSESISCRSDRCASYSISADQT